MFSFPKSEHLCSKTLIGKVFAEGKSITDYPVKAIYLYTKLANEACYQVLFTIPKKTVRKAVKRNLLRRRMREVFRLNGQVLAESLQKTNKQLAIIFIFIGKTEPSFNNIELKITGVLQRLSEVNEKNTH